MEAVYEWPEPVVRVQTLAGAATIPDRYVKPLSERPKLAAVPVGSTARASNNIPVIDFASLASGRETAAVAAACGEWGFFQLVNHGIETAEEVRQAWREFFALPMEEKQRYANSPATFEGYGSRLGVVKGAVLDWGDYFFLHLLPPSPPTKWPSSPSQLRGKTEEYCAAVAKVVEAVKRAISAALGVEEGYMAAAFGQAAAAMRVNYYPKCPQPELTLGLSPHSDPGGLTFLLPDEHVKGLQVRHAGEWVTVDPVPGGLIVNIGDQIQLLSNGTFKSVEHRVTANAAADRISVAYFHNPQDDLLISPASEIVKRSGPAVYKPIMYREYKKHMRMLGLGGKSHVDSLRTT
ncbi:jasmonate-induced oxygenase 4-like [Zingiber officinale]|uniref:jasmonate-induced oxygenase 4-like n=1 Tax=Zingiber officinale TaxID=94328 RepID=UPI001C4C84E3|nr:jasmonate-induced oxygenase 4-like [Zingiber officinale]